MFRQELTERSPLRIFERSIHGGLGPGNIGVAVGRAGVGKTAFLVGVALDYLLRGRRVLHVALDQPVEKVREYYDEIFQDLASTSALEDAERERREMERNRYIHACLPGTFSADKVRETVGFLQEHTRFSPEALIVDGFDFSVALPVDLEQLRQVARDLDVELWMSAVTHRDARRNARGVPEPVVRVEDVLSVIVSMAHDGRAVHVRLLKDHDNPEVSEAGIALNPTTMLLMRE